MGLQGAAGRIVAYRGNAHTDGRSGPDVRLRATPVADVPGVKYCGDHRTEGVGRTSRRI